MVVKFNAMILFLLSGPDKDTCGIVQIVEEYFVMVNVKWIRNSTLFKKNRGRTFYKWEDPRTN